HIKSEGRSAWNNNDNHLTSRYAEYKNFGPSSNPRGRVKWSKQLTDEEAKKYSLLNVLNGWNPK
ncbi:MAG: pectinesterase family protein, partial [Chitinophagaceae bacterium]